MFRHMLKVKTREQYFTSQAQEAAQRRMNAGQRAELADAARQASPLAIDPAPLPAPAKRIAPAEPEQRVGYMPSVLLQTFLPQRQLPEAATVHVMTHGRAWLAVSAGIGADEHGQPLQLGVPSGGHGRLVLAHLATQARHSSTIVIGRPREFLEKSLQIGYGGNTALQVGAQVANLGACGLILGYTRETGAGPDDAVLAGLEQMSVASGVRYADPWKGRCTSKPRPPWITQLELTPRFRAQLLTHRAPVRLDCLVKLRKRPRAMDLFSWLSLRIPDPGEQPAIICVSRLHPVFAPGLPTAQMAVGAEKRSEGNLRQSAQVPVRHRRRHPVPPQFQTPCSPESAPWGLIGSANHFQMGTYWTQVGTYWTPRHCCQLHIIVFFNVILSALASPL